MTRSKVTRRCVIPCCLLAVVALAGTTVRADDDASPCVTVDVNGYKALPYDCFQERMSPATAPDRDDPALHSGGIARQAPNRLGLFNQSTLRTRMGNTFGRGVRPQRPTPATAPPLP